MRFALALVAILSFAIHSPRCTTAGEPTPEIVKKIKAIEFEIQTSQPPNLVIKVTGEVPTTGYSNVTLVAVTYVMPPPDGIQDYVMMATPPEVGGTVVSDVTASATIKAYTEIKWLKGVRVHGVDKGVMTKMLKSK